MASSSDDEEKFNVGLGLDLDHQSSAVEIRKVYVGNLNSRTSTLDLQSFFSAFGDVQNAHFARKRDGTREHFGFVTFYEPEDARRALSQPGLKLNGSFLVVKKAADKHQPTRLRNGKIMWTRKKSLRPGYKTEAQAHGSLVFGEGSSSVSSASGQRLGASRNRAQKRPNEEIDETKCCMHLLNDDCLMHIFSFLPKTDLIKSEGVCKRWQSLCMQMWLTTKHLDFSWMSSIRRYKSQILTQSRFAQLLIRCGPNLSSLDIAYRHCRLDSKALEVIAEECPNLQCLNLSRLPLTPKCMKILYSLVGNLRRLILESCKGLKDSYLKTLFLHSPHLNSVVLANNSYLSGECLKGLTSETIEELILDNCSGMRSKFVIEAFTTFKNLKRLSINACINLTCSVVNDIFKTIPQLESLSMSLHFPLLTGSALTAIAHLTQLVSLTLHQNPAVNDSVMVAVAKSCKKLEHLDLTGCSVHTIEPTLTDAGIASVAQLPNLRHLKMSYMATLTNESLESLAERGKLKTLVCRGCPTFTDFGCSRLVSLCNELALFDVSGCNYVSSNTVNAAIDSVKLRTNNVKLKMIVGGTTIYPVGPVEEPLLELDPTNLCVDRHRPDFVDHVYFLSDSDDDDDDMDDLDHFDWECQSMFFGDDLGEWFLANIENNCFDDSDDTDDYDFQYF